MKKTSVLTLILSIALFISCEDNGNDDPTPINNFDGVTLRGTILEDLTIPAGSYTLQGDVVVENGVTLTIEPGTTFTARNADGLDLLIVRQGGTLIANGTANNLIVFTADEQEAGQWGGITIAGRAPVNFGIEDDSQFTTISPAIAEVRNLPYGGTSLADNSGILNYVRVEYAGAQLTPESEFNSFSFYGVGSGTTLTNLQAYNGKDDGFEFFGGTVNASNLIATGCEDDSLDWTEGWTGSVSNIYIVLGSNSDSGFEGDGNGLNNDAEPFSNPQLSNISIIGTNGVGEGMNLREGTNVNIDNVYLTGFDLGGDLKYIEIDSENTIAYIYDGSFELTNINFGGPAAGVKIDFPANDDPVISDYVDGAPNDIPFDGNLSDLSLNSFTESDSTGAGAGADVPDWATNWIKE